MNYLGWYFAGVATFPLVMLVLFRIFRPKPPPIDNRCLFCGRMHRCESYEEAKDDAIAHIHICEKHPLPKALALIKKLKESNEQ